MKKIVFLVIALLVTGLVLTPQTQAQDIDAMNKLIADFMAGKITMDEYQQGMTALIPGAMGTGQGSQQQQNSWPSNTVFNKFGLGSITQPAGTVASFREDIAGYERLSVVIRNGTQAHCDAIAAQLRRIQGIRENNRPYYEFVLNNWTITVIEQHGDVQFSVFDNNFRPAGEH